MLEAVWSVEFGSTIGSVGAGIVVFETGRVFGGDSAFMYIGKFRVENGIVHAEINVSKYSNLSQMQSIFGDLTNFNLAITGTANRDVMLLTGVVVGSPSMQIALKAIRRAELP